MRVAITGLGIWSALGRQPALQFLRGTRFHDDPHRRCASAPEAQSLVAHNASRSVDDLPVAAAEEMSHKQSVEAAHVLVERYRPMGLVQLFGAFGGVPELLGVVPPQLVDTAARHGELLR